MTTTPDPMTDALTVGEAARLLGEDVNLVRRWARTEQCPTIRDGRRVRIPAAWVAAELDRLNQ